MTERVLQRSLVLETHFSYSRCTRCHYLRKANRQFHSRQQVLLRTRGKQHAAQAVSLVFMEYISREFIQDNPKRRLDQAEEGVFQIWAHAILKGSERDCFT